MSRQTLEVLLTILGMLGILAVNVCGWVWFFATLQARVVALEKGWADQGRVNESQARLNDELPHRFVPREEIAALLKGVDGKLDLLLGRGGAS